MITFWWGLAFPKGKQWRREALVWKTGGISNVNGGKGRIAAAHSA